ncbi:hypothetical protein MPSEU_001027400 [Mayamaea pseudoterrestris]|nr:hypothetical protein MPSEU_001027400 [Mayamaea pseudoterrestris]
MLRKRQSPGRQSDDKAMTNDQVEKVKMHLSEYTVHIQGAAVALWLLLYILAFVDNNSIGLNSKTNLIEFKDVIDLSDFAKCGETPPPVEQVGKDLKSFWFSQFPDAVPDELTRSLVQGLTGLSTGAKSYYAQSRSIKRCQGGGTTVACMQIHPMFGAKTEELIPAFNPEVFYFMRNPNTIFPAHQNSKAIKYGGQIGQTPEDGWRIFRDTYFSTMSEAWKDQLMAWKQMDYYNVAMYLPLEDLMRPTLGPQLVKEMAAIFRSRGYATIDDADIPCLWYQSIGKDKLELFQRVRFEYDVYTPGFTKEQIKLLATGLEVFANEVKDDAKLVEILRRYLESVRHETRLDHAWVNQTRTR